MWSIAKTQLAMWHRKGAVERRNLERLAMATPSIAADEYERIEQLADLDYIRPLLASALAKLTPDQRQVLQHRVVEERDYERMAHEAGISQVAMRMRVSRAIEQLANLTRGGVIDREALKELSG
jgi:RNA polymerase sigma factor (sigma-70 family)